MQVQILNKKNNNKNLKTYLMSEEKKSRKATSLIDRKGILTLDGMFGNSPKVVLSMMTLKCE